MTGTQKGKGRPKKTSRKSFNFGKPKVLDFTSIVNDNVFLKESNLIHLRDIKSWNNMCQTTSKKSQYKFRPELNCKVSIIQANITNIKVDAIVNAANVTLLSCSNPYISVIGFECHPNTPIFPVLAYLPFYQLKASGTSSQFFSFLLIWLSWVINFYEFSELL